MKKLALCICTLLFFGITFATVGGPTFVENIHYDQEQNAIRYTKTFYDGFGGSEIHKYAIDTEKDEIITNLENLQFEEKRLMSDLSDIQKYFKDEGFYPLQEFQLNKIPVKISLTLKYFNELINNESFEIAKVAPHPFIEDGNEYMMSGYIFNFIWENKVYINNQIKSQIELSTCRLDPINYRGFGLENLDTILIIATSAKKDCMEGGYLGEEVHSITGVQIAKELFLTQKSIVFSTTGTLQASTGGLWIEPQMQGENIVSGASIIEAKITIWETIKAFIKKILGYIGL